MLVSLLKVLRLVIVAEHQRKYDRSHRRKLIHISQMDRTERALPHCQHQLPPFLQGNVCRPKKKTVAVAAVYSCQGFHTAGNYDHSHISKAAAGRSRPYVPVVIDRIRQLFQLFQ